MTPQNDVQRWQAASVLREQFPHADASAIASAIWEVFSDGRETCSNSELGQRCGQAGDHRLCLRARLWHGLPVLGDCEREGVVPLVFRRLA